MAARVPGPGASLLRRFRTVGWLWALAVVLSGCGGDRLGDPFGTAMVIDDPYRPQVHYAPPSGWMNDPNGLVYAGGVYHLFYQYNPFGDTWGNISWGYATSPDLVRWTTQGVALPARGDTLIFSGSAVEDAENTSGLCGAAPAAGCLIAVYTASFPDPDLGTRQVQSLAVSRDNGRTWTDYAQNPVLDLGLSDFRDPKVFWHRPSQRWVMAVTLSAERQVAFFASPDLRTWTELSRFGPAGATEGIWEVPDLVELPLGDGATRWVLKVDVGSGAAGGGSGGQYFVGDFDGRTFTPETPPGDLPLWLDHGADFYAAVTWNGLPNDRRVWIGWMSNWAYAERLPPTGWRGAMTLPRTLGLRATPAGLRLTQTPIREIEQQRGSPVRVEGTDAAAVDAALAERGAGGRVLEIEARLRPGEAEIVGFRVREGADEFTTVGYDRRKGEVFVHRHRAGVADLGPVFTGFKTAPLAMRDALDLRIFVDRSSVEVFAEGGLRVLTNRIFPDPQSTGLTFFAEGGAIERADVTVWPLRAARPGR